ncbi:MAG TPA: TrkH family potassium uptake protein [Clostridiales bacterium]|nr:TrkH family potassium uptake protein [Clostridiales bacterium]
MNYKMIFKSLGMLLICEAIAMIPSLIVSIIYSDSTTKVFSYTISILLAVGIFFAIALKPKNRTIYARDGFAIVAFGWVMISLFGALPFYFSGAIPSFIDCIFETVSGFTTTGSSILQEVESLPKAILFWRSFTHWIGGMGVLILTLALFPITGTGAYQVMIAESPGPIPGKLVPKVANTAKILYKIYISFTLLEIVLLVIAGLPLFDACIHTFGSVGTGGFSSRNASIGSYNNVLVEAIITIFTFMCGVNFSLYYQAIKRDFKAIFKDEEFRFYLGIVLVAILFITVDLYGEAFRSIGESIRYSTFQVVTIITTTGYSTADFDKWPLFSKMILFVLMFIGGCAGSTAGGMKNIRILSLIKSTKTEILRIIHPRGVYSVRIGEKTIEEKYLAQIKSFFFMYMFVFVIAVLIVSLDGFDIATTFSSVAATLSNIGPGFAIVGPMGNYSQMSVLSKLVLSLTMLIGRLEIYPMLLLTIPSFWRKVNI